MFGALARGREQGRTHVVTTAVEHSAVRDAATRSGADVTEIGVDRRGRFDASEVVAWAVLVHLVVGLIVLPGRRDWVAVCGAVLVVLTVIAREAAMQAVYGWGLLALP